jgi:hypothetical protein
MHRNADRLNWWYISLKQHFSELFVWFHLDLINLKVFRERKELGSIVMSKSGSAWCL